MSSASLRDKILCAAFYTAIFVPIIGWIPLIWLIISNVQGRYMPEFLKYHCYQAVLFNMLAHFLPQIFSVLIGFISSLLGLMVIFDNTITLLQGFSAWLLGIYAPLIQVLAVYAIIWTLRGKYTYMPPISQAVNLLLR